MLNRPPFPLQSPLKPRRDQRTIIIKSHSRSPSFFFIASLLLLLLLLAVPLNLPCPVLFPRDPFYIVVVVVLFLTTSRSSIFSSSSCPTTFIIVLSLFSSFFFFPSPSLAVLHAPRLR